jgi:hypothetical protein
MFLNLHYDRKRGARNGAEKGGEKMSDERKGEVLVMVRHPFIVNAKRCFCESELCDYDKWAKETFTDWQRYIKEKKPEMQKAGKDEKCNHDINEFVFVDEKETIMKVKKEVIDNFLKWQKELQK